MKKEKNKMFTDGGDGISKYLPVMSQNGGADCWFLKNWNLAGG
jgi:hypothetical protein